MTQFEVTVPAKITLVIEAKNAREAQRAVAKARTLSALDDLDATDWCDKFPLTITGDIKTVNKTIAEAKALLTDKRADGNHGFMGDALTRWEEQRDSLKAGLRLVIAGKKVPERIRSKTRDCPRDMQYGGGTVAGAEWVDEARNLI